MNTSPQQHRELCTFFDKNYLGRGLALYYSLMKYHSHFTLWILCMDDESFIALKKMNLPNIKLLTLSEVEDERMRAVKHTRTPVEYIWMFGSQLSLYMLEKKKVSTITYLDADMFFYSSFEEIYTEFGDKSVMIIPHRYSSRTAHRERTSGTYNVGMMIFKNDPFALECLRWWKDRCIEWCFNRYEDGKFGDQLYLNDWPTRFKNVHVLQHLGANVAPWNIDNYRFHMSHNQIIGTDGTKMFNLIFYHFHPFKIYMTRNGTIRPYPITIYERRIYRIYLQTLQTAYNHVRTLYPTWDYGTTKKLDIARVIKQYITIYITR